MLYFLRHFIYEANCGFGFFYLLLHEYSMITYNINMIYQMYRQCSPLSIQKARTGFLSSFLLILKDDLLSAWYW